MPPGAFKKNKLLTISMFNGKLYKGSSIRAAGRKLFKGNKLSNKGYSFYSVYESAAKRTR